MASLKKSLRLLATGSLLLGTSVLMTAPSYGRDQATPIRTQSQLGSYLAGRFARSNHDTQAAAAFYIQVLERDPTNAHALEQSFLMQAAEGNLANADDVARKLLASQPTYRLALNWVAAGEYQKRNYAIADEMLRAASGGSIGELTSTLARAWIELQRGNSRAAMALLDNSSVSQSAHYYVNYHRGLIADLSGRVNDARTAFAKVFALDKRTPRLALAYARHAAHRGDRALALQILDEHVNRTGGEVHPLVADLREKLNKDLVIPLLVESPTRGFTEVFFSLGEAIASEGAVDIGTIYLQMALRLRPKHVFALSALANVYETTRRFERAIEIYDRIPQGTAMRSAIEIRKAINLNEVDRTDEAKAALEALARQDASDKRPLLALGDIMRARKRYSEAVDYFTRVIAMVDDPQPRHWMYWYSRGTSYERLKMWPQAEVDLLEALRLAPEQPLVLNYLGYSWIDQNRNLERGLDMIRKAVSKKPEDGYIVDSLGWAHFRLGNFDDAVEALERAVELQPEDPTLNDHLGDAYWRVGRLREAKFQWEQAIGLKPEADELPKIQAKLKNGLPPLPLVRSDEQTEDAPRVGRASPDGQATSNTPATDPLR